MLIKITFQFIVLIFSSCIAQAQYFESIQKETERILISLSDGNSADGLEITELKNLLTTYVGTKFFRNPIFMFIRKVLIV